jgi:Zn finger protein HypA/HybF involved in hydrogenase expression
MIEMPHTTNSSMAALRSNHDLLCGTYTRFHLLCATCQRCVGFAREAVQRVPCPVCGSAATEVYVREPLSVVAALNGNER